MESYKFEKTYSSACVMTMICETNGPQGGDGGHGGFVKLTFKDEGSTSMEAHVELRGSQDPHSAESIEIGMQGDCEASVFAQALIDAGTFLKKFHGADAT